MTAGAKNPVAAASNVEVDSATTKSSALGRTKTYADSDSTSVSAPLNFFGAEQKIPVPPLLEDKKITAAWIREQIPAHLFQRSAFWGFVHIAIDLAIIATFGYAATFIQYAPLAAQFALWPLFWFAQGTVMTGIWVLAHECGHQSFSDWKWLNDLVGWVLHSALLVPYHSWRISHSNHHSNTCSMENDEVFVPSTRSEHTELIADTPLWNAVGIFNMLVFGWPGYIGANFSGPAKYRGKKNSHFNTESALFDARSWFDVLVSVVGFLAAVAGIVYASTIFGVQAVVAYYFIPYLVVNAYLVLITYLQHTDTYVRHYRAGTFTWLRGALSTVDRSFGWLIDAGIHHIADTHVVHHLFSTMPFYNAIEATKVVRKVLGPYYLRDDTPIPAALWRSWKFCRFVEDEGEILFYKTADDLNKGLREKKGKKSQ